MNEMVGGLGKMDRILRLYWKLLSILNVDMYVNNSPHFLLRVDLTKLHGDARKDAHFQLATDLSAKAAHRGGDLCRQAPVPAVVASGNARPNSIGQSDLKYLH